MNLTLPTLFTLLRIAAAPLMLVIVQLPVTPQAQGWALTITFILAALTDWVDGYLARRLGQTTPLGAFLDPVADKLVVCTALVLLVDLDRAAVEVVMLLIWRELSIASLREWAARRGATHHTAVSIWGKAKTATQMVAIPFLLSGQETLGLLPIEVIGSVLLWAAAALALGSMVGYMRSAALTAREI